MSQPARYIEKLERNHELTSNQLIPQGLFPAAPAEKAAVEQKTMKMGAQFFNDWPKRAGLELTSCENAQLLQSQG